MSNGKLGPVIPGTGRGEMEDLWVRVRKLVRLADKATVTVTGLRDAAGCEMMLALQFEQGVIVSYSEGPPPVKEGEERRAKSHRSLEQRTGALDDGD